jgi:hypothetical protein
MFRWGNPAVYDRGSVDDQQLFFQHDAHWIDEHLDPGHPFYGKIAVYNNRVGPDSSSVNIIDPLFLDYAWMYGTDTDTTFLPTDFTWSYSHTDKSKMFSGGLSSIQFLNNGNWLVFCAQIGYGFEVTWTHQIVWAYKVPLRMGNPVMQGELLAGNENLTWRMTRYPSDFPGFAGRDLTGKGYVELNPDTTFCELPSSVDVIRTPTGIEVYPNPASQRLVVTWDGESEYDIRLRDALGREVSSMRSSGRLEIVDIGHLNEGMYWITVGNSAPCKVIICR